MRSSSFSFPRPSTFFFPRHASCESLAFSASIPPSSAGFPPLDVSVCSCKHNSDKVSEEEEEGKEEKDEKVMSSSFSLSLSLLSFASEKKSDQSSTSTRHNRRAGGNFRRFRKPTMRLFLFALLLSALSLTGKNEIEKGYTGREPPPPPFPRFPPTKSPSSSHPSSRPPPLSLAQKKKALSQNGPNDDWQKWLPTNWRSLPQFMEYKGAPYCGPCRFWDSKAGAKPGDESACRYWAACHPGANGKGGKNCGPDSAFVNDNWLGHCENVYTGRYP